MTTAFVRAFHWPYLYFTLIVTVYLLVTLYFLVHRLQGYFGQLRRKYHPPAPFDPRLLAYQRNAMLFWLFFVLIGLVLLSFSVWLASYQYVAGRVVRDGIASLHHGSVHYVDGEGNEKDFRTNGSEVAAAGIFLRFPPWMGNIGLESYHKLISFRGNRENQYHYMSPNADWLNQYADPIFLFIYRNQKSLGFVNASYKESPYFSGAKRRIFVTHSGYIIQ